MVRRCQRRVSQTCLAAVVVSLTLTGVARAADDITRIERQTLDAARLLVPRSVARLPITLATVMPDGASTGILGWTTIGPDGAREGIFIYTRSGIFRCAWPSNRNHQCLLRLASVIVHEAWHFSHRGGEAAAYAAQLTFMMANHAALEQIADVQMSRDRAVAAERAAVDAARKRARDSTR